MIREDVDLNALRAEAQSVAALLRSQLPKYATTQRALQLEADAPRAIAALWESVGWSDVFVKCLESPELALSERRIAERMADYRSWGEGFTLTPADLPARRRLVEDDGQGVAFVVTDETKSAMDAPVLAVRADDNQIGQAADSYVRWCTNHLVRLAFSRWYSTGVLIQPSDALEKLGNCPWPLLTRAARELTADVFCLPPPLDPGTNSPQRNGAYRLAYRSLQHLIAFLETLEVDSFAFSEHPSDYLQSQCPASKLLRGDDKVRWLPSVPGKTLGVGTFAGEPMIVVEHGIFTNIYVNPRAIERLKPIRDARLRE